MHERLFGLRYDPLFKSIYFKKKNMKKIMNDLFHEKLEDFEYHRQELPKENVNLKSGVCDIVMKSKKRIMIVEIQNQDLKNLIERMKYYVSGYYSSQKPGKDYKGLIPVEVYLIINFPFGEEKILKEYEEFEKDLKEQFGEYSKIKIWNIEEALKMEKGLDYEYGKLMTLDDDEKRDGKEVLEKLGEKEEHKELVEEIKYYNEDEETYRRLREVNMLEMTFEQATAGIRRDAFEKGEKKGILKTAISMLKKGTDLAFIKEVTGLTEKEILEGEKASKTN